MTKKRADFPTFWSQKTRNSPISEQWPTTATKTREAKQPCQTRRGNWVKKRHIPGINVACGISLTYLWLGQILITYFRVLPNIAIIIAG